MWLSFVDQNKHSLIFLDMQHDTDRTDYWKDVQSKVKEAYISNFHDHGGSKGLVADFHVYDTDINKYRPVKGFILEKFEDADYGFNACR